ncbi:hyoscyamine 6-dioxygenase-like [Rhododendron vialii]|uniref:hyoscyamine 6-dioxygenase-like n=1 Tax=Rhododendron vialii TaxID=182163 RepID=UPI00265F210D|nr:hyoscyamine 6-dioxygenase-like [Rhododendron vialii]
MVKLISSRCSIQSVVPESYILPPEQRPGNSVAPPCKTIPVIDLLGDRSDVIQEIIKASHEYGFFQLRNHGVSEELMKDALVVAKEFFDLPVEEKERFYSEDPHQSGCMLKTSIDFPKEKFHFWRDNLRHPSHPLEDHIHRWPENPARYREVFGPYSMEVRSLGLQILELNCEGLGLESGYFGERLSEGQLIVVNYYPPCPDPTLVLGLPKHGDPHLITLLNQGDVPGLQVWKDEQWVTVEPNPNAFVVNINHMLQIISNGKLKSAYHRVLTSSNIDRTTVASFILPSKDSVIEPAKSLVSELSPPLYKSFKRGDFDNIYFSDTHEEKDPLEHFRIRS